MWIVFMSLVIAMWVFSAIKDISEGRRLKRFLSFCAENADDLINGCSREFEGEMYDGYTQLVRYQWCCSIVVMTFTRSTSFYCAEGKNNQLLTATLITAVAGWWGFPWGPIQSIRCLINNTKTETVTVRDIIMSMAQQ